MSVTRVQFQHTYPGNSVTFDADVTVGNLIVVASSTSGSDNMTSLVDNLGNTYKTISGPHDGTVIVHGSSDTEANLSYCVVETGGSCTITVTWEFADDVGLTAYEYSGLGLNPGVSQAIALLDSSSPVQVSVNAVPNGLVFGSWADEYQLPTTFSPNLGFTIVQFDNQHYDLQIDNVDPGPGISTPGFSYTGTAPSGDLYLTAAFWPNNWFMQTNKASGTAATASVSLTSSTAAGNMILVTYTGGSLIATPTDNRGNTYHLVAGGHYTTAGYYFQMFYAYNIAGGSVTVSATGASEWAVIATEYTGLTLTDPLDQVVTNQGTFPSSWPKLADSSPTATTSQAYELVVGAAAIPFGANPLASNSFFNLNNAYASTSNNQVVTNDTAVSATGAQRSQIFCDCNGGETYVGMVATFKLTWTTPPPPPNNLFHDVL